MTIAHKIPNYQDLNDSLKQQSAVDTGDFKNIAGAVKGTYVTGGGAVSANSGLQISVAAGSGRIGGVPVTWSAATPTHDGADDTDPRVDVVVVNSSGTVSILKGDAAEVTSTGGPEWASSYDPDSYILLARIDVTAAAETVATANIVDKRLFRNDTGEVIVTSPGIGVSEDASDNSAAIALCNSGAFWWPPGTYTVLTRTTVTQGATALSWRGVPGTVMITAGSGHTINDAAGRGSIIIHTTSGTTLPNSFYMEGIDFCGEELQASSITFPFTEDAITQWPHPNGVGTASTSECWSTTDAVLTRWEVTKCRFFMDSPDATDHVWTNGGGDQGLFVDLEEIRSASFTHNEVYASRDSGIYAMHEGTRTTARYPAKIDISHNYWEGCGNAVGCKGDLYGHIVSANRFVNCAVPIAMSETTADGETHHANIFGNTIDGYWKAIHLKGNGHYVYGNHIFNAGVFDSDGSSLSDQSATLDDNFDHPYAFVFGEDGDFANNCLVVGNKVSGSAANGSLGRSVDWGGYDPDVFRFTNSDNNRCHDNWIEGTAWRYLASDANTGAGNIVSWSRPEMLGDHSLAYASAGTGSKACGPVVDVLVTSNDTGATSDDTENVYSAFNFEFADNASYHIDSELFFDGDPAGDVRMEIQTPGSTTTEGWWTVRAPSTGITSGGDVQSMTADTRPVDINYAIIAGLRGAGDPTSVHVVATVTARDAGTVSFAYAQGTSDATATRLLAHSRWRVERIA
jgi:hypothetical protein